MNVSFKDNTLKVVTDITRAAVEAGISDLTAKDEKGNAKYAVVISKNGKGNLDTFGMTCNAYIEDKAAVVVVLPVDTTQADVQKQYGEALIAAAKYTEQIASEAGSKAEAIAALFTE